jgi:glutathione-regulated potassium-efflux system ancillary protein KefF
MRTDACPGRRTGPDRPETTMNPLPRILILYAHPSHHLSRVNRRLIDAAQSLPNVTLHDLYECYPDFHIDVAQEQTLLAEADLIVFQHPVQWYSMPSLLKEWVDVVLEDGWAYGPGGTALHGKDFWLVVSTGGVHESYDTGAYHGHPFAAFLPPYRQTAALCGMRWQEPLILHGARQASDAAIGAHAQDYLHRLQTYPAWARSAAGHDGHVEKQGDDALAATAQSRNQEGAAS